MTEENGRPAEPDEPPAELKTINQIVAWNVAYFRRAAGLTQEQLGTLTGRSKRNVSADERSWDGDRTREFNAHTLIGLALALGVPLNAFFLPPPGDGKDARYIFRPPGSSTDLGMADLMRTVISDSEDRSDAMGAYRRRMLAASEEYLDEGWQHEIAVWLLPLVGAEVLEEGAYRLRAKREQDLASAAWAGRMADALDKARAQEGGTADEQG